MFPKVPQSSLGILRVPQLPPPNMYISVFKMTLPTAGVVLMEVIDVAVAFVPMSSDATWKKESEGSRG